MKRKRIKWIAGFVAAAVILSGGLVSAALVWGRVPKTVTMDWILAHEDDGILGRDARNADFTQLSPPELARLNFDSNTQWPDQSHLPAWFQPDEVLEAAKDPGLGLRELHRQGITGKGINVAVIDKHILPEHRELAGRIKYIEVSPEKQDDRTPHFHGMAAASILAGATVGVAPEALLYYFAVPNDRAGFKNYVVALEQLLALNATLPREQKIRVVSVSWGPSNRDPETKSAWLALVAKAREQGTEVVDSGQRAEVNYTCAGVLPGRDRNDPETYEWAAWLNNGRGPTIPEKVLGVPASYRTTASVAGPDAYVYWGDSGVSWAIPYVAGLLALGQQVSPGADFDDLYRALEQTATPNAKGVPMLNPAAYIKAVQTDF